jgi:ribosomal protein S10
MAPKKAPSRACISLHALNHDIVDGVCDQIKTISDRTGVSMTGPIPLPTRKLKVPVRNLYRCGRESNASTDENSNTRWCQNIYTDSDLKIRRHHYTKHSC